MDLRASSSATSTSTSSTSCCAAGIASAACGVFDAGCGGGRNLVYLLRQGYEVFGNDASADGNCARCGPSPRRWRRPARRLPPRGHRGHLVRGRLGRRRDGQRRAALRPRRCPLRGHGAGPVAGAEAGRPVLRAAGVDHRHGARRRCRAPLRASGGGVTACRTAPTATWSMPRPSSTGPPAWAASCSTRSRPPSSTTSGR